MKSSSAPDHLQWEALVGQAILRFGDIELVSIKCLAELDAKQSVGSAVALPFRQRALRLVKLLEAREPVDDALYSIMLAMRRAGEVAGTRNLIAHNPVMLEIYESADEIDMHAEHAIRSVRSHDKRLDLAELKEFTAEVDDLASKCWLAFANWRGHTEDLVHRSNSTNRPA